MTQSGSDAHAQVISRSRKSSWVDAANMVESWVPTSIGATALVGSPGLAEGTQDVVRLGDLFNVISDRESDAVSESTVSWIATTKDGAVCIIPRQELQIPAQGVILPDEAVVIGKRLLAGTCCAYWSKKLFDTNGVADSTVRVLIGQHGESVAWLVHELQQEYCVRQLQRAAHGSIAQRIAVADLLDILVPARTADERDALSQAVIAQCASSIQSAVREDFRRVFLTAMTFEERLSQFESYIQDTNLASEGDLFFVEALTNDHNSDFFIARPVWRSRSRPRPKLSRDRLDQRARPQETPSIDGRWRDWYWDEKLERLVGLFNTLNDVTEIPAFLLARMRSGRDRQPFATIPKHVPYVFPSFAFFRGAVLPNLDSAGYDPIEIQRDMAASWFQHQGDTILSSITESLSKTYGIDPTDSSVGVLSAHPTLLKDIFDWARFVYRPIAAVKVIREGRVIGAYMLFGGDQLEDPEGCRARLEVKAAQCAEILSPPPQYVAEVTRRESLRRLSWVMHQFNGPLMRVKSALADLDSLFRNHPDISQVLAPEDATAHRRAEMAAEPLERHTAGGRLADALKGVEDIRRITYQIRRLRRVQGALIPVDLNIAALMDELAGECRQRVPGLQVNTEYQVDSVVHADRDTVRDALNEVFSNACRELLEQRVQNPQLDMRLLDAGTEIRLEISDNALPVECDLIGNPFDEDVSTYARSGRGTGLGLAIVRETFRKHGSQCQLVAKRDSEGHRIAGVTFSAELPKAESPLEEEQNHV